MNLKQKLAIADQAIKSISTHNDEDAAVLDAALEQVQKKVDAERAAIAGRVAQDVKAKIGA